MVSTFRLCFAGIVLAAAFPLFSGEVLPPDKGLDGGKGGHWGAKSDKDWVDNRWSNTDVGPIVSCALAIPGGNANKGVAVRAGEGESAAVCFDAEKAGICAAWTGKFVKFSGKRFGLIEPPAAGGSILFSQPGQDLWNGAKVQYRGLYMHGARVTLASKIDNVDVLESPWSEKQGTLTAITRTLQIGTGSSALQYTIAGGKDLKFASSQIDGVTLYVCERQDSVLATAVSGRGASLQVGKNGAAVLVIEPRTAPAQLKVFTWSGPKAELAQFAALVKNSATPQSLDALCQPGPARWGSPLPTKGSVSTDTKAYVLDSLGAPFDNPYKALFFCSGIDFLENGDAAISTLHGDVWIVSGIDKDLKGITWKRFATGLFQPFGVRVVDGKIYVLGRDQITRLNDLNNDGEADFYENFCNKMKTSPGGHDYSAGLDTDSAGNFYHVDPFGVHRVSKNGASYETIVTGWRNPVSVAVGPDNSLMVAPQEGEWTPASMIAEVKPRGYYGFGGPKVDSSRPLGYDLPLCYIPRLVDNSSGGMIWAPAEKWGPLSGQLINLSFGQCSIQLVLRETVDGQPQGGVVPLSLRFQSGLVRGRVRPQDGQLYLVGTQGWVTGAVRDGCLQRVRYTGAKQCLPVALHAHANGLRIVFSDPLERAAAEDIENYGVEQWNYRYAAQYGSKEYSVAQPETMGHDAVVVSSAKLSADGRELFLGIPDLKPVMQMRIKYLIKDAGGETVRGEINSTVHKTGAPHAAR